MRPVAIVLHEESVPPGIITGVLEETETEHFVIEGWRQRSWPAARELGALIVMGGTMNVDQVDDFPFLRDSKALMSESLEDGVPTLGVCLGSQMMARVLGAGVNRAERRNAFFSAIDPTEVGAGDPVIEPFASGLSVLQFHEDTFEVPASAEALATSATSGLPQAFRYGRTAYAIQFHFEVDDSIVRRWLDDIGPEAMADQWGISTEDFLAAADRHLEKQSVAGKDLVQRFLEVAGISESL